MARVRVDVVRDLALSTVALCLALVIGVRAQGQILGPPPVNRLPSTGPALTTGPREGSLPPSGAPPGGAPPVGTSTVVIPPGELVDTPIDPLVEQKVVELRVIGNESRTAAQILNSISTRVDRPFDQTQLEKDVRTLALKKWFLDVRPIREQVPGGVRITFEVIERPMFLYVKYLGNTKIKDKRLAKETDLKRGSSLDPYAVEEGRRKVEEYYKSKGYNDVRVVILEGTKPGDRGAIYMINEGEKQKIKKTVFVGNNVTSGNRLKTQIESKPPILGFIKGQYSEEKISEDIDKLVGYYRNLGFFRARISREVVMDEKWRRPTITFIVDEGPRYRLRGVNFIGNRKFTNEQLATGMKLKEGEFFLRRNLDSDITKIQDVYGTKGYVFANVQQELRFEEEPGELTVVFSVEEGSRYAVGEIKIHIGGDTPHTRFNAVLNRLMFRPGDVINTQLIRNAERRLKASGLFCNDPSKGQPPKITFSPPGEDDETSVADRAGGGGKPRFQSPDGPGVRRLDMHVFVDQDPDAPAGPDEGLLVNTRAQLIVTPKPKKSWWPWSKKPAGQPPAQAAPATDSQSSSLPPLDITADEILVVRGQGPTGDPSRAVVDDVLPPPRIHNTLPPVQPPAPVVAPADSAAAGTARSAAAAKSLSAALSSLSLTSPVSLTRNLSTLRAGARPGVSFDLASYAPQSPLSRPAGSAAAVAPAKSPPVSAAPAARARAAVSSTGQAPAGFVGHALDHPRTKRLRWPALAAPVARAQPADGLRTRRDEHGYSGNVAFQSPGGTGTLPPPQFSQPLPGMPTDPTAPEEPEELPSLPINVGTEETQTGKFMFGVGVNSNAGLVGNIVIDEQNFDWQRWPNSVEDWRNGTAFRGGGQHFRIELAPGTVMSRYLLSYNNPYLYDTNVSFGWSGYYFQRFYYDWYEQRLGGKVNMGYQFRPDLTGVVAVGAENVRIEDARILVPDLQQVLGNNGRFGITFSGINDTRDNTFFPTDGRYINLSFEQVTGSFTYPRVTLDMRKYFVLHQRADGSGRQVLALYSYTGVTGKNTPIYDRFFLGGIGTIRGFYYRDASPTFDTVTVGGDFASYGTIEYTFPVTADDMFRLAAFVDGGFDSRTSDVRGTDIRIAPGLGIRISVPAMGPAPIAVDFAIPVVQNSNDQRQLVNFAVGVAR